MQQHHNTQHFQKYRANGVSKALFLIEQYLADTYSDEDLLEGWASPLVEAAIALQKLQAVRIPITGEVMGDE